MGKIDRIIKENIDVFLLNEGYLQDIYSSPNFLRWFNGSKIVDENGNPLLLGHATRSFGFNKFNTKYIHLSSIKDASYFSGGNKRMFRYKNTLDKLLPEELIELYNKYFAFDKNSEYRILDENAIEMISNAYQEEIQKVSSAEYIEKMKKYGIDAKEDGMIYQQCYNIFMDYINNSSKQMFYKISYKELPRLRPYGGNSDKASIKSWLKETFVTSNLIKRIMLNSMFEKDRYEGKGGTYPLCARVLKPLHIDCNGNPWDRIYLTPNNCEAYDGIFDIYNQEGWNRSGYSKGSWIDLDNETIAWCANKLGYDGVVFHNIKEGAYGNIFMKETYIVFSTKQLKSPFENNGEFGDKENIFK